ncbi:MAG: hypothetical protein U0169_07205 [Polyangiaceae bacterium]
MKPSTTPVPKLRGIVPVVAASALGVVLFACGGDDEATPSGGGTVPPDAGAFADVIYAGPVRGGEIVRVDASASSDAGPNAVDGNVPCCTVDFVLPDPSNDETTVRVEGPAPVLSGGLPATWSNGAWRASACVPVGTYLLSRFHVTRAPDADAGEVLVGDASVVDEYRTLATVDSLVDGEDRTWNVDDAACVADDAGTSNDRG